MAMLRSRLEATLAGLGLEPVGTVGEPFDPTHHEAIYHEPDPTATAAASWSSVAPRSGSRRRRAPDAIGR
ncbi:MAG: nucleotide exchange factor GrpE [Candidatus Limnocylindria bacterium]